MIDYDVAIVGAGFAGITAARELGNVGLSAIILEGRDRIGGRTTVNHSWGIPLELGGQWVHWTQPHVWTEITRYGFELEERAPIEDAYIYTGGDVIKCPAEELSSKLEQGYTQLYHETLDVFERPFDPLSSPLLADVDQISIGDRLDEIDLTPDARDALHGLLSLRFSGPLNEAALTQGLRHSALVGGNVSMSDKIVRYKLRRGTHELLKAMLADTRAEIVLSSTVRALKQDSREVTVETADGGGLTAKVVILTSPINALKGIEFYPPLSSQKARVAQQGQTTRGMMFWILLEGDIAPFMALAPGDGDLVYLRSHYTLGNGVVANAFGADASRISMTDRNAVQTAVRQWLPDAIVAGCLGHDWTRDIFSRGLHAMLRPGQLSESFAELQEPDGRIFLAGSDYAIGWHCYIDGAIESGLRAARGARKLLGVGTAQPLEATPS